LETAPVELTVLDWPCDKVLLQGNWLGITTGMYQDQNFLIWRVVDDGDDSIELELEHEIDVGNFPLSVSKSGPFVFVGDHNGVVHSIEMKTE